MCRKLWLLLLGITCTVVSLAEKVNITPEPLWVCKVDACNTEAPKRGAVSDGYYFELSDHQTNLSAQTEFLHAIRHIVSESGVQNASEVSVSFSPSFQKVNFHKIILWRNGSIICQLNASQIQVVQEESDASEYQYNGMKRAFVVLKGVQKNDRIEYAYSITGFNPVFGNHFSDKIYFTSNTVIANYFETYIVPAGRTINIKSFNNAPPPVETQKDNMRIYQWSNPPVKMQESQPGVPGWFDNYPYVTVSEFNNWQEVVDWGVKLLNNYQYPLTEELTTKIKQWQLVAKGDKELYTNLAIRFVQDQVRYLGLEIGAYTHQPHAPATVFHQRFGDCKDKALLLAVLLQQAKIPAYVALVNTVVRSKLSEATPSTGNFDHAIVAIQRSSGYIYADATMAYQRGEPVNLFIPNYGYALLLREGETTLQPVEAGEIYNTSIEENLLVSNSDSCRLMVSTIRSGGSADAARNNLADASTQDLEETYKQYYAKTYDGIQLVSPIVIADDSTKNQLTVTEHYSMPSLWHTNAKGKKSFDVFAKSVYEQIPDPANAYQGAPLALVFPRTLHYVLELTMPEDWPFAPEAVHIKTGSYQFDFTPEVNGNIIRLRYYYKTFKDHIPANEVAQYKIDYKKIENEFEFNLFDNGESVSTPSGIPATASNIHVNWLMVLLSLIFVGGMVTLARYLNKKSAPVYYTAETGWPLGGWVAVLGISLGIGCLLQLVNFAENTYFSNTVWKALEQNGGQNMQLISVIEMAFSIYCIGGIAALLFWFMNRRDIFPRMFIGYIGSMLMGQLIMLTCYNAGHYPAVYGDLQGPVFKQMLQTGIYGLVWGSYVVRSERVKSTFLQPYH